MRVNDGHLDHTHLGFQLHHVGDHFIRQAIVHEAKGDMRGLLQSFNKREGACLADHVAGQLHVS